MTVGTTGVLVRQVIIFLAALCAASTIICAQDNVGIGTSTPEPSALLHLESTTKGFLAPRMTTAERDAIPTPATGLMIFNVTLDMYQYNFGTPLLPAWVSFLSIDVSGGSSSRNFWSLLGNDSVNAATNFIGTRTPQPLLFKTDNMLRMTIDVNGTVTTEGGVVVRSGGLNLLGGASPLLMDGNAGGVGQLLVSGGPMATPTWTRDLVLNAGGLVINTRTTINGPLLVTDTATFTVLPKMPLQFGHMLVGNQQNIAAPMAPGINGALLQIVGGSPTWVTAEQSAYWSRTGNAGIAMTDFLGTTDANDLRIATNAQLRMTVSGVNGKLTINDLAGVPLATPLGPNDGLIISDASGQLGKRSVSSLLALPDNHLFVGDVNNIASPLAPGPDSSFLGIVAGEPTWFSLAQILRENAWIQGGNLAPSSTILGNMSTTGSRDLDIRAGGQPMLYLNGTTPQIDVTAPLNLAGATTPLLAGGSAGNAGNPFVSSGAGQTPRWTTGMAITDAEVQINAPTLTINSAQTTINSAQTTFNGAQTTFIGEAAFNDSASFAILPRMPLTFGHMLIGNSQNIAAPVAPGINGSILQIQNGNPTWIAQEFASYWALSGNSGVSATDLLGTRDGNDLRIGTNNQLRMTINAVNGGVNITSLAGAGLSGAPAVGEGVIVADASGSLAKRDISSLLQLPQHHIYVGNAANIAAPYAPGPDSTFLGIVGGQPQWVSLASLLGTTSWAVGGNLAPSSPILGNMAAAGMRDLDIRAGGSTLLFLNGATPQIDVRAPLNLAGPTTPLLADGVAGAAGNPFVSSGAGQTPRWTSGMSITDAQVQINSPTLTINSAQTTFVGKAAFSDSALFAILPRMPLTFGYMLIGDAQNIAAPVAPGINGSILQIQNGNPTWIAQELAAYWSLAGNSGISPTDFLGTRDANDLRFATNSQLRMSINAVNGGVNISSLSGPGINTIPVVGEGVVVADASGSLIKRDISSLLQLPQHHIYVGNAQNIAAPYAPGPDSTFLGIVSGQPQWVSLASLLGSSGWLVGGNTNPSSAILGNMAGAGMRDLDIRAGGTSQIFLNGSTPQVDIRVPLNLSSTTTPFMMNGQAGAVGSPLVSAGAGATPTWSTGLSISNTNITVNADAFIVNSLLSTFNNNVSFLDSVKFTLMPEFPLQNGYTLVGNNANTATPLAPGINGSIFQIVGGMPTWTTPASSAFWSLSGNAGIGATDFLGTTDANDLRLATNNQLRLVVASGNGSVTVTNLSGAPINATVGPSDGIVVADASGMLVKRDRQALLEMLGIYGGRYVNQAQTELFSVVVTLPSGATLDPNASITLTPEASSSVSVTPFVVSGSRTSTTFTINFPGGLNPGESINWMVRNP